MGREGKEGDKKYKLCLFPCDLGSLKKKTKSLYFHSYQPPSPFFSYFSFENGPFSLLLRCFCVVFAAGALLWWGKGLLLAVAVLFEGLWRKLTKLGELLKTTEWYRGFRRTFLFYPIDSRSSLWRVILCHCQTQQAQLRISVSAANNTWGMRYDRMSKEAI